jgi:hypothetical protein
VYFQSEVFITSDNKETRCKTISKVQLEVFAFTKTKNEIEEGIMTEIMLYFNQKYPNQRNPSIFKSLI